MSYAGLINRSFHINPVEVLMNLLEVQDRYFEALENHGPESNEFEDSVKAIASIETLWSGWMQEIDDFDYEAGLKRLWLPIALQAQWRDTPNDLRFVPKLSLADSTTAITLRRSCV